ncbi:MAG: polysaccharide deacetylase family protein [Armatimonadota bacterium]
MSGALSQSSSKTRRLTLIAPILILICSIHASAEPWVVHSYPTSGDHPPRIALTFDDGPSGKYTPQLLDIFAEHGGHCTFMTLGRIVSGHKQILRRAEAEGHEIGIHSWWHANYTGLSTPNIQSDIRRSRSALDAVIEGPVRWVRPPYGAMNSRVREAITDAGYRVAMWSVDPHDWQNPGSEAIASRVLKNARDGAVVLLHDGGGNRAGTVAAMRTVVPELQRRGYQLVTLSELTGLAEVAPDHGLRLSVADEVFEVEDGYEDVKVTVNGAEIELSQPPLMINEQFIVQARPVLAALGSTIRWDPGARTVSFDGARGEFVVTLNSLDVTLDDEPLLVKIPSVYHEGTAMLPVWLMANACGAIVEWDAEARRIEFSHQSPATRGVRVHERGLMTLLQLPRGAGHAAI